MSRGFSHTGRIVSVSDSAIEVELEVQEACSGCQAKAYCGTRGGGGSGGEKGSGENGGGENGSGEKRVLRVDSKEAIDAGYQVGEEVEVEISYGTGLFAVMIAYVIPLILFVSVLCIAITIGVEEGVAAVATFAVMAIYYIILYILRRKLERDIKFNLRRKILS